VSTSYAPENFRDVGEALALWLSDPPIAPNLLLRGGKLDLLTSHADIAHARTIINLREVADEAQWADVTYMHVPAPRDAERYDTSQHLVRDWIRRLLAVLDDDALPRPIYLHCARGRDRTGLVVAAWLLAKGVEMDVVIEEYMLSSTASDPLDRARVAQALATLSI
jgi:protein-tyrosine phosphatase